MSDDPQQDYAEAMRGILYDRSRSVPMEWNEQTRAERAIRPHDRPMHYGTGLEKTLCEVYHPFKQTITRAKVTCGACLKIINKRGAT